MKESENIAFKAAVIVGTLIVICYVIFLIVS